MSRSIPRTRRAATVCCAAIAVTAACADGDDGADPGDPPVVDSTSVTATSVATTPPVTTGPATTQPPRSTTATPTTATPTTATPTTGANRPRRGAHRSVALDLETRRRSAAKIGIARRPEAWITRYGIDGFLYPAGPQVDLIHLDVSATASRRSRRASMFFDFTSSLSRSQIVARTRSAIDGSGRYEFTRRTENLADGVQVLATGTGRRGTRGDYDVIVISERPPDSGRFSMVVTRRWDTAARKVPKPIASSLAHGIAIAARADMPGEAWRHYQGLDVRRFNTDGTRVIAETIEYDLATRATRPGRNADRVASEAGPLNGRRRLRNGTVTFRAAGATWRFFAGGGGDVQIRRAL